MKQKRFVRTLCALLALLMIATLVLPMVLNVFAAEGDTATDATTPPASDAAGTGTDTSSTGTAGTTSKEQQKAEAARKREELQQKLDALRKEAEGIQGNIDANKNSIQEQEKNKQNYQQKANNILAQMEALKQKIEETKVLVTQKQDELATKILEVNETQKLFDQRMVEMYTGRNQDSLSLLLGAKSFSSALRYSMNLQSIAENDTRLIQTLQVQQAELEVQKLEFEAQLAQQQQEEEELEQLRVQYIASIQAADQKITDEAAALEANEAAYADNYAKQQQANQEMLAWLSSGNEVDFEYGGGQFFWPCPGYRRISSDFGWRNLWGKQDFHRGVDMAGAAGTPIYAAEAGKVSTTAHWSYGVCVKISHGSGLVTLYGHMLQRVVSEGEYVTRGQLIGYVGSTGNSDGNHLHFEVNLNGSATSPWPYLNG